MNIKNKNGEDEIAMRHEHFTLMQLMMKSTYEAKVGCGHLLNREMIPDPGTLEKKPKWKPPKVAWGDPIESCFIEFPLNVVIVQTFGLHLSFFWIIQQLKTVGKERVCVIPHMRFYNGKKYDFSVAKDVSRITNFL